MQTDTVSIADFIKEHRISMTAERTDTNPNMDDGGRDMDHWKVVLKRRDYAGKRYNARKDGTSVVATMTTYFSMGYGHHGKAPKAAEVLDCIASDASGADGSFEDFCSNFGYDEDSRKAEKTYKACKHQGERLRKFLGDDAFQTLVYGGVERL
jgi:hypothetical protein